jgi:hypothetical protein
MRQWLLMSWVWLATGVMAGLITLTLPAKPVIATLPPPATASAAKPPCIWGITNDVNRCGSVAGCVKLPRNDPPGPRNCQQCVICTVTIRGTTFQIQGHQIEWKEWYDCNNDNIADCEIWRGRWRLKSVQCVPAGSSQSLNFFRSLTAEEVECICPEPVYDVTE